MSFMHIPHLRIAGISSCVPAKRESVFECPGLGPEKASKFSKTTGVFHRRIADESICTSDLCQNASETIIRDLGWKKEDIACLVFVSQTPDYILPATSCILQDKLRLKQNTIALDISLGCSGWVYGLSVIGALMSAGKIKKGLLLTGDTALKGVSPLDESAYPLFGDAGTATAIEYDPESEGLKFHFGCDGSGYEAIIVRDGGYRNMFNEESLVMHNEGEGIIRNRTQTVLDGMNVFSFGISKAPESVNALIEHNNLVKEDIDYFVFHQANLYMNEVIRKKLKIPPEKVPYSLADFGNTSSASIPITINASFKSGINASLIACGFGVGLSWSSVYFTAKNMVLSKIQEL